MISQFFKGSADCISIYFIGSTCRHKVSIYKQKGIYPKLSDSRLSNNPSTCLSLSPILPRSDSTRATTPASVLLSILFRFSHGPSYVFLNKIIGKSTDNSRKDPIYKFCKDHVRYGT